MTSNKEILLKLQRTRAGIIGSVKKEILKADGLLAQQPVDIDRCQVSLMKMEGYVKRMRELSTDIQDLLDTDTQDADIIKNER